MYQESILNFCCSYHQQSYNEGPHFSCTIYNSNNYHRLQFVPNTADCEVVWLRHGLPLADWRPVHLCAACVPSAACVLSGMTVTSIGQPTFRITALKLHIVCKAYTVNTKFWCKWLRINKTSKRLKERGKLVWFRERTDKWANLSSGKLV